MEAALNMRSERRQFPRKKPEQLSYINLEADNGGMLLDLSEGGVGFHAVSPLDSTGGKIRFWFSVKSIDRIDVEGQLVWTDENRKSGGVRFIDLPEPARKQIRAWLASVPTQEMPASAAATPNTSPKPMSDFDAQAEEVIGVAEAALGSAVRDPYVGTPPVEDATEPSAEELISRESGAVDANARSSAVSASAVAAVVAATPAAVEMQRRLMITPNGIQADRSARQTPAAGKSSRRFSMLFDEGEPDYEDRSAPVNYGPPIHRQSQAGVVFGTLAVLALIAGGVYAYLYHDRVGSFLESLGARMTHSRPSDQAPQTVSAAPPLAPNSVASPQSSAPTGSSSPSPSAGQPNEQPPTLNTPSQSTGTAANPNSAANGDPSSSAASSASTSSTPAGASATPSGTSKSSKDPAAGAPRSASADSPLPDSIRTADHQPSKSAAERLPAPGAPDEGGTEELTAARKLLGTSGSRGNTLRAEQLLWSAVEKGNLQAEVELADLYVSGAGVAKNCTQARVLLQSAAKRDSSEALRRLADLHRHGCP